MSENLSGYRSTVNQASLGKFIVMLSLENGCWECRRPLPFAPSAVVASPPSPDPEWRPMLVLVCSPECAKKARQKILDDKDKEWDAPVISACDTHAFLLQSQDVVAIIERQGPGEGLRVTEGRQVADRLAELLGRSV